MTDFIVVIPARYQSSRFPGKPLVDICGQSMIERTWRQACKSSAKAVYIATDDARIVEHCRSFTDKVLMTKDDHVSGTDRLQEVAEQLNLSEQAVIVNVQGDEPCIPPANIDQVAQLLSVWSHASVATLVKPIHSLSQWQDANVVKAVLGEAGEMGYQALNFSRASVPFCRDEPTKFDHGAAHIGIYAYKVAALNRFVHWPEAQLEQIEKLEQCRFLANGDMIVAEFAHEEPPAGVDSPKDLEVIEAYLKRSS